MTQVTAHRSNSSLIFGSLIALLGVVLLLDNFEFFDAGDILKFWPLLLIVFGAVQIARRSDTGPKVVGMIVAIVGVWLLLNNLEIISMGLFGLWPLLLIGLGVLLLTRASKTSLPAVADGSDFLTVTALLGGARRNVASTNFLGGRLTAIMGGCEIDLRQADIKGESAALDVFVLMGGLEITMPPGWSVESSVTPVLGGVDDKSTRPAAGGKKLVVTGSAIMGGVEFKN
jgi:predicted membrane protein